MWMFGVVPIFMLQNKNIKQQFNSEKWDVKYLSMWLHVIGMPTFFQALDTKTTKQLDQEQMSIYISFLTI